MDALREKIRRAIADKGPITFEAFMDMSLYEPLLGYYMSPSTEIGRAGDYYTSPHLHPIFGAMLGMQMEEMWQIMGKPHDFKVIEMGAGRGHLSKDMLDYLREREIFKSLTYTIVELNLFMKDKQQDLLCDFSDKVQWVSSLSMPCPLNGCVLSNELLDSFPVHLIEMEDELKEIYVGVAEEAQPHFIEIKGEVSTPLIYDYLREFSISLPKGYRTEVNLRIKKWLNDVYGILKQGFILTIDYGYPSWDYYGDERTRGTLLCYEGHEVTDNPYEHIGQRDITAHVNFSSLKKWGDEIGLRTLGFCPQGTYLVSLGIDEAITELYGGGAEPSPDYSFQVARMKGLFLPGTIGETHKVMVQYKGSGLPFLKGFHLRNQIKNL